MKIIFMLPMIIIDASLITLFVVNHALLAEKGLTGLGYVSLCFISFYAFATVVQFAKGRFDRPAAELAKRFLLYGLFIAAFIAVFIGGLFLGLLLHGFLFHFIGEYASTAGAVLYACILIFMTAALREANCRAASIED